MEVALGALLGLFCAGSGVTFVYGVVSLFQRRYRQGVLLVLSGGLVMALCYPVLVLASISMFADMLSSVSRSERPGALFSSEKMKSGVMFGLLAGIWASLVVARGAKERRAKRLCDEEELLRAFEQAGMAAPPGLAHQAKDKPPQ